MSSQENTESHQRTTIEDKDQEKGPQNQIHHAIQSFKSQHEEYLLKTSTPLGQNEKKSYHTEPNTSSFQKVTEPLRSTSNWISPQKGNTSIQM